MRSVKDFFEYAIAIIILSSFLVSNLQAGKPLWTIIPSTKPTVAVPAGTPDSVAYTVTNLPDGKS